MSEVETLFDRFAITEYLNNSRKQIESWFKKYSKNLSPIMTTSVDIRHARYKISAIDTNIFPGGYNNLHINSIKNANVVAQKAIKHISTDINKILIVVENHSKNKFYLDSIEVLVNILSSAGYELCVGLLPEANIDDIKSYLPSSINIEYIQRASSRVHCGKFMPDLIWLNNDCSLGVPPILNGIYQNIIPMLELGWHNRKKSQHFMFYEEVCEELCNKLELDPWLFCPYYENCGEINFKNTTGIECIVKHSEELFSNIEQKYKDYSIKDKPFIVIKADSGTYGLGVMKIESPKELLTLNRKQRKDMSYLKDNVENTKVILQEGIHSKEYVNNNRSEHVMYLLGNKVIGGFHRSNSNKNSQDNLNRPGMQFHPINFDSDNEKLYPYEVIARLAALAASMENRELFTC